LRNNKNYFSKQKNYSNETKTNNKIVKKINFLYYLVNESFILLDTKIESVKHSHLKEKYIINKNIKK